MAEVKPAVLGAVAELLTEDPGITNRELYQKAVALDEDIAALNLRQFNARYTLQVKRQRALAEGRGRKRTSRRSGLGRRGTRRGANSGGTRDQVRQVLLGFASDLAGAEQRKDLVEVLANVDRYVDQVLEAADS